jgi:hypothetical protein
MKTYRIKLYFFNGDALGFDRELTASDVIDLHRSLTDFHADTVLKVVIQQNSTIGEL